MFGLRCSSSVLFQEPNVREVRCSIFQCSRCSKFGFLMFVPRLEMLQEALLIGNDELTAAIEKRISILETILEPSNSTL